MSKTDEKQKAIYIYPAWLDVPDECAIDLVKTLREYTKGNFAYKPSTPFVHGMATIMRGIIQSKYTTDKIKGDIARENGGKGGRPRKKPKNPQNPIGFESVDNETKENPSGFPLLKENIKEKENYNIPPIPIGGAGGGGGFSFNDYYKRVKAAYESLKDVIKEQTDLKQTVWRCADFGQEYSNKVAHILVSREQERWSDETLMFNLQDLNAKYKPKSDFMAALLAIALIVIPDSRAQIIINEVETHLTETDIYKTMLGKIEWVKSHEITNFKSFVENRN